MGRGKFYCRLITRKALKTFVGWPENSHFSASSPEYPELCIVLKFAFESNPPITFCRLTLVGCTAAISSFNNLLTQHYKEERYQ